MRAGAHRRSGTDASYCIDHSAGLGRSHSAWECSEISAGVKGRLWALGSGLSISHFRLQISDLRLCLARIYFFRCWHLASDALYPLSFNSSSEIQLGVGQRAGPGPVLPGRPGSAQEINLMFCIRTSFRHAHPQQRALWHRRVRHCLAAIILSGWIGSLSMPLLAQGNDTGAPASAAEVRELRAGRNICPIRGASSAA